MDKWISVEDELPEKETFAIVGYIIDGTHRRIPTGARHAGHGFWYTIDWTPTLGGLFQDVTHWMPLPAPPESE